MTKTMMCLALMTALAICTAGGQTTGKKAAPSLANKKHPQVSQGTECSDCHKQEFQQWYAGKHGLDQVKCLVCHGGVNTNFIAKPSAARCEGCHAEKVDQLRTETFMKGKGCFTCHPPHGLRPHGTVTNEGGK